MRFAPTPAPTAFTVIEWVTSSHRRAGDVGGTTFTTMRERVQAGLIRAKAQGKVLGRRKAAVRPERVLAMREKGLSFTHHCRSNRRISHD